MTAVRVLQVVASINEEIGGPAVTVPALAQAMVEQGAECTLAALDYARHGSRAALGSVREVILPAGVLARNLRGWSPSFARALHRLARDSADIVHGNGLWMFPNLYARQAAGKARLPLVISPRGMLDPWSLERSAAKKAIAWHAFERGNLRSAAAFHATSDAESAAIRAAGFRQPIAMIANGVAFPESAHPPGRGLLEDRFHSLRGVRWLLFLSRLHPKKGIAELLSAWQLLEAAHPDWHLVLAGPDLDGYGESMRRQCAGLGLEERVTFTGMLKGDAKESALGNAELFVLPTHSENFGIAVAEALAHGMPAITTRGAPWQALEDAGCGWWIGDSQGELEAALGAAMALDARELRAMGARGRSMVARDYSWMNAARQMLSLYEWLLGRGPRPPCVEGSP